MSWNIEEAITYYKRQGAPANQTALVNLLKEAQAENGGSIPVLLLPTLAEALGIKENFLLALIRRIPSLRLAQRHVLEICAGPNCGKHTKILDLARQLAEKTEGRVEVKCVPCMRLCGKGPNVRWDGMLHCGATAELLRQLIQIGR